MKKLVVFGLFLLAAAAQAQTPVFKCESGGKVTWSDKPCGSNSKVVKVKPLGSGEHKNPAAGKYTPQPVSTPSPKKS
ncbi:DUF4124 domain-containing protein [Undibacterium rugosum]|uniref:DUF4124 domain-containing protein n=1 Tax=Undibacterium rugosum TaxID=2762291 RepID=A0A923I2E7_9BURK|nr:DUF4124 domain-containing protein [Undibacterium rugosum]MBC3934151.1 DUF4124 domain-containing protein [Undibacterium rugosum]MBR7779614.1 DUF4124 domain-containing protein [Undibacterium rugosum]